MINLQKASLELLPSYLRCMNAMAQLGEKVWEDTVPFAHESSEQFVQRILLSETNPIGGRVEETHYWAVIQDEVVGRISFRHRLTEDLKNFGGHIGYEVHPAHRKKGVATAMLKAVLETPRAHSIGKLLLTCAPNNIASNKTIVANGGVLKETRFIKRVNRETNFYWIDLTKSSRA